MANSLIVLYPIGGLAAIMDMDRLLEFSSLSFVSIQ